MSNTNFAPDHIARHEEGMQAYHSRTDNSTSAPYSPASEAERIRKANPAQMVQDVEKRLEAIERMLGENRGFDQKTGNVLLTLPEGHAKRRALELERHQLKNHTLPYTKQRAAYIAGRQAAQPTLQDKLQAQLDHQRRVQAAARARVEEMEVDALARRMAVQRRIPGGGR